MKKVKVNIFKNKYIFLVVFLIFVTFLSYSLLNKKKDFNIKKISIFSPIPNCPSNLEGLVTYQIMEKGSIKGLIPLGNSNPPGHTFPVDHIYFNGDKDEKKYNVFAAGDGYLTEVTLNTSYDKDGKVISNGIVLTIEYCKGVSLVNALTGELSSITKEAIDGKEANCKTVNGKHEGEASIKFCGYKVMVPVKANDVLATTNGEEFPEIWALNKNITLSKDVDWERYNSPYYQYAFCFFDMYKGELKNYYYNLFGLYTSEKEFDEKFKGKFGKQQTTFEPRTIQPICGKVNQNIKGTVKGDWFGEGRVDDSDDVNRFDLALIEDNQNPIYQRIVIGGTITDPALLTFLPKHSGEINRAFEEVKADENIYCYDQKTMLDGWWKGGKIVLQLVDDHNLKIEWQKGECTGKETLINPHKYDR